MRKAALREAQAIAAGLVDLIGLFEDRDAGPLEIAGIDGEIVLVVEDLEPVVEAADHERADGAHGGDGKAFGFAAFEAALDGLGNGDGLGEGETDSGVDADAAIRRFLDGGDTGAGGGDLDDHVGRELREVNGLRKHGLSVAVVARVSLD